MKITARVSAILCVIFAFICLGVAITGFSSLGEITDAVKLADAKGFSWFWTFLAVVSAIFGVLSWWIVGKDATDPAATSK